MLKIKINNIPYAVNLLDLPPDITLNTFIREHAQLTATKYMCLEGGCGACICVINGLDPVTGKEKTWATNSCLTLLNICDGWEIITNEGLGNKRNGYHPIQNRLAKMNGTQCGYCSPGFVMNMYGLLAANNGKVTMEDVENSFGGNICRCTGYRPILDAMKSFATDSNIKVPIECQDIEDLQPKNCPKTGKLCEGHCKESTLNEMLIFADGTKWFWPKTLADLFDTLNKVDAEKLEYMLVAGNTAHGVYRRSENIKAFIDLKALKDLKTHRIENGKLILGANLSLTDAMDIFLEVAKQPGFEYCQQLWNHFDLIANVPVRNMGTLAGNISIKKMHPEFPSDIFICFEALVAKVIVGEAADKQRSMSLKDYLKTPLQKTVILAFELPAYSRDKYTFQSYKIMPRAQNAHAYVNAAFIVEMISATPFKTKCARICYGGINPDFVHATNVENLFLEKEVLDDANVAKIFETLSNELKPDSVLPDASPEYRMKLACGLFYKFLLSIAPSDKINDKYKSGAKILKRPLSSGIQTFETNKANFPVGQAVQKIEGLIQCSGEATYMNDVLTTKDTVYCAFVHATVVGATIEKIDATNALKIPGVLAFYSAKDIPGTNTFVTESFGYELEEIFCAGTVKYYDQPLGVIVAETSDVANRAVNKVNVMYSKPTKNIKVLMSDVLKDKIANQERIHLMHDTKNANDMQTLDAEYHVNGIFEIGSQYHFTMEPQTTVVVPFEDGLQVWCSTQWMDHTQNVIANMLQMKNTDVQLKVRRLGGGYGGKITRNNQVACAAALVAHKLNRPTRFVQTIESMMGANGKRWSCISEYDFHIASNGKIKSLKNDFYEDGGCTLNESPIGDLSVHCSRNCYNLSNRNYNIAAKGVITDAASTTWCRAPGSVEGIAMIENIIEHIAFVANIDPVDARLINIDDDNKMKTLLQRFVKTTEYHTRRKEIDDYNEKNRWRKRGIGITIMQYPVQYFGQYPATVAIYHSDGTVVITHGGIEMGQGMNTKVAQVASYLLGVPLENVRVEASDTISSANSMVTGGSIGSEVLCYAVTKCCKTLNNRLEDVRKNMKKNSTWQELVEAAWVAEINLVVNDYYKTGDLTGYHIYGLGLTEIEVDITTGNCLIRRVDLLEDCGESLSPYIDIGQIEGAFVMLLGYYLSEQLVYDRQTGKLLTNRTWNYKPPGVKDIPIDFRIELLQNQPNPAGFMRSKATGEPPACLAISVLFALQHALQSARKDAGLKPEWIRLGAPTTPETIVLNAGTDVKAFTLK